MLGLDERNKLELERLYQQLDEKDEINQLVAITRRDYGALQADMNRIIGLKAEDIVPRKQSRISSLKFTNSSSETMPNSPN